MPDLHIYFFGNGVLQEYSGGLQISSHRYLKRVGLTYKSHPYFPFFYKPVHFFVAARITIRIDKMIQFICLRKGFLCNWVDFQIPTQASQFTKFHTHKILAYTVFASELVQGQVTYLLTGNFTFLFFTFMFLTPKTPGISWVGLKTQQLEIACILFKRHSSVSHLFTCQLLTSQFCKNTIFFACMRKTWNRIMYNQQIQKELFIWQWPSIYKKGYHPLHD